MVKRCTEENRDTYEGDMLKCYKPVILTFFAILVVSLAILIARNVIGG